MHFFLLHLLLSSSALILVSNDLLLCAPQNKTTCFGLVIVSKYNMLLIGRGGVGVGREMSLHCILRLEVKTDILHWVQLFLFESLEESKVNSNRNL